MGHIHRSSNSIQSTIAMQTDNTDSILIFLGSYVCYVECVYKTDREAINNDGIHFLSIITFEVNKNHVFLHFYKKEACNERLGQKYLYPIK